MPLNLPIGKKYQIRIGYKCATPSNSNTCGNLASSGEFYVSESFKITQTTIPGYKYLSADVITISWKTNVASAINPS